ncbi:MAG: ABC-type transport auxiliary lipoprotein family protein [Xanthomonadaceae bacterium]|jgi:cholesterol transport system auxiliary component|nr:ABC-type transport auxiliary lipoprotein family protein [Xanthomonadaceae bacterium]
MRKFHLLYRGLLFLSVAVLTGCAILSPTPTTSFTIYAPDVRIPPDPAWPQVSWRLIVAKPTAQRMIDSTRIVVSPSPGEWQVYKGVVWSQPAPDILEATVLRALEDSGRIASVGRLSAGIRANYRLIMDIRRFESDYTDQTVPVVTIEVSAKLLDNADQHVIAARTFLSTQPAASVDIREVVDAFEQALAAITHDVAGWTLTSGEADARTRR